MADQLPAIAQVEDALAAQIGAWPDLAGWSIRVDESADVAIDLTATPRVINIYTVVYKVDQSDEQNQSVHDATVEFEVVSGKPQVGTISRSAHATVARIMAALHADRTLGGLIEDIQEDDVAPAGGTGKDVGNVSLQCTLRFYTPRGDWFTIV